METELSKALTLQVMQAMIETSGALVELKGKRVSQLSSSFRGNL